MKPVIHSKINYASLIIVLFITLIFISCAPSLKIENMIGTSGMSNISPKGKHVQIAVKKTFKEKMLSTADFKNALERTIIKTGMFVVDTVNKDYIINAVMVHWFQPPFSMSFHTDLRVHYLITDLHSNVIYDKELESHSVAKTSEAFSGAKRSKMSFERAIKQNIEMFLTDINQLSF